MAQVRSARLCDHICLVLLDEEQVCLLSNYRYIYIYIAGGCPHTCSDVYVCHKELPMRARLGSLQPVWKDRDKPTLFLKSVAMISFVCVSARISISSRRFVLGFLPCALKWKPRRHVRGSTLDFNAPWRVGCLKKILNVLTPCFASIGLER